MWAKGINEMKEVWKRSKDCPYIEVSNLGNVRTIERTRKVRSNNGGYVVRTDKSRLLTPTDNGSGYKIVNVSENGKRHNAYIHRLVAKEFVDGYQDGFVVDHINHDRADNRAVNLEWVSQKENVSRSVDRMCKPKAVILSNTGERYISQRMSGRHKGKYRVFGNKQFNTLNEAIAYRNEVIANVGEM